MRLISILAVLLVLTTTGFHVAPAGLVTLGGSTQDPGFAKGTLKVDGQVISLTHAYAWQYDNEEGLLDAPELRILLTDREVSPSLLSGAYLVHLDMSAREGKVRGLLLTVDPGHPSQSLHGTLLYPPTKPQGSLHFFSISNTEGVFEKFDLGKDRVAGEVRYREKGDPDVGFRPFEYAVSFSAPLLRDEPITAKLTGRPALESPPVQALLAYERALLAGDLEAARRRSSPEGFKQTEALMAQVGKDTFLEMMRQEIPDSATRQRQIRQVFVRGLRALVIFQMGEMKGAQMMVQVNGVWLVE